MKLSDKYVIHRKMSVMSYSLFSAWLLSFLFEGQVMRSLIESTKLDGTVIVKLIELVVCIGLFTGGFFIKEPTTAKKKMVISGFVCITASLVFYFPVSILWYAAIIFAAFFSSIYIVNWGFYFKFFSTLKNVSKQQQMCLFIPIFL